MRKSNKTRKRICVLLVSSLLISANPPMDVFAAQQLYNYSTKSTMSVADTKITYKYNGATIDLSGTPGILTSNNVALAPYIPIFNKKLGIKTKYDKANKTVTFKQGGTTVVLTLGSKTALVNGKKVTMSAAPISAKYKESNKVAILVPTRFIAETFGYYYEWNSSTSTVTINKNLKLSYGNQTHTYSGVQGKVSFDGKNINVTNMPTLIFGNTAMIQAYRVFSNNLGVKYRYYPSTGKLTFTQGNITLKMELGSSIAEINGQAIDCGVAPQLVKNVETGVETVMVPAMFVSKALGYDYSWNSNTKTSEIFTSPLVGVKPNLVISSGSTGSDNTIATQYFKWTLEDELSSVVTRAEQALNSNKNLVLNEGSVSTLASVTEAEDCSITETLNLVFNAKLDSVSATHNGNQVIISLKNTFSSAQSFTSKNELINRVSVEYDSENFETNVIVTLNDENANFSLTPSADQRSLSVDFYPNYITEVAAGIDADGYQYISFDGLSALHPKITEDDTNIYLEFNNTRNGVGEKIYVSDISDVESIDNVMLESPSINSSILIVEKPTSESTYETHEDGTTFMLYIDREEKIPVINDSPIQIYLPEGIKASDITDEDQYYNKQIILTMPGDYRNFYTTNPIVNSYSNVANIKVSYSNKKTVITITTNKIQGYEYKIEDGILTLTVDAPSKIYDKIVILDAGHGGKDPGAVNGSTQEKVINFNVLNVYAKQYFANSGIKVYYTRVDDTLIALKDRANFASEVEADLFISLHCNAASNSAARGTSVYYSSTNKSKTESGLTSKILATRLVNSLSSNLGTKNLGIIDKGFVVVRDNTVPAVLIELAFLTNPGDKANLVSASFQKNAAKTIYETVVEIFNTYPTNR